MNHSSPPQSEKLASDNGDGEETTPEVQSDAVRKQTTAGGKRKCPGCDVIMSSCNQRKHRIRLRLGMPCAGPNRTFTVRFKQFKCLYCDQMMTHTQFHRTSTNSPKVAHLYVHAKTALVSEIFMCPIPGCKDSRRGVCAKCPICSDIIKAADIHKHTAQRHTVKSGPTERLKMVQEKRNANDHRCSTCQITVFGVRKVLHDRRYHPFHDSRIACYRCGLEFADYQTALSHMKRLRKLCLATQKTAPKDQLSVPSTSSAIDPIVSEGLPSLPNYTSSTYVAAPSSVGETTTTTSADCCTSDSPSLDIRHLTDEPGTSSPNVYALSRSDDISPTPSLECRYCAKVFAKGVNLRVHEKLKHKDVIVSLPAIAVIKDEPGETDTFVCANSASVKFEVKQESSDFGLC